MKTESLSPEEVESLRLVLRESGEGRRTLPASLYTDPTWLAWERESFFSGQWMCIGRSDEVPGFGDQRAVDIGVDGILLVRDKGGVLRGFFNACRHRGHELTPRGQGANRKAIRCPYHGWVYGLDGRFAAAPRMETFSGFDREDPDNNLVEVALAEWHGWIFCNPSGGAIPFADYVGNLEELVAPWEPQDLVTAARREYLVDCNWKIFVEGYHECYHCPSIHPAFCELSDPTVGITNTPTGCWAGGMMELREHVETMVNNGETAGGVPSATDGGAAAEDILVSGISQYVDQSSA